MFKLFLVLSSVQYSPHKLILLRLPLSGAYAQGIVIFNSPDFDPEQALADLLDNVTKTFQPIASACTASSLQNRFIVSGRGGIPANPSNSLRSETTWNDVRDISRRLLSI